MDYFPVTPGSGRQFAADRGVVLPDGTTADVERIKVGLGGDDDYVGDVGGTVKDNDPQQASAMWTEDRPDCFDATPTLALSVTATPTAYANGDNLGGLLSVANAAKAAGSGVRVDSVTITDARKQSAGIDVLFFRDSITTPLDHSAFAPTGPHLAKNRGVVKFVAGDWSNFSANGVACHSGLNLIIPSLVATTLYIVLVCRTTPTFTANDDLTIALSMTRL